jgi:hypothetical protein
MVQIIAEFLRKEYIMDKVHSFHLMEHNTVVNLKKGNMMGKVFLSSKMGYLIRLTMVEISKEKVC